MDMTAAELTAIRERLGWRAEQLAAEFGVTPHVVAAWERGTVRVSRDIAQHLRWRVALVERDAVVAASGLASCPTVEALDQAVAGKEGKALLEVLEQLNAHGEACPLCQARVAYADRHGPALPDLPLPRWIRIGGAINALFDRLPAGLRPPDGDRGHGRRMGLWFGVGFSLLAILIVALVLIRGRSTQGSWREAATMLAVIIPAYFVGFYCAGAAYDALRPIGHRFIGYVLRWGLGGAIVYGAIFLAMSLGDDNSLSWSEGLTGVLFLGGLWALIGAGLWVKDRLTGKLARRSS